MYTRSRFEQSPTSHSLPSQIRTQLILKALATDTHLPLSANGCQLSLRTPLSTSLTNSRRCNSFVFN